MTDTAPERIWAHIEIEDDGEPYIEHLGDAPFGDDSVEYVRADLDVKVRPLEWEEFDAWTAWAVSTVGTYNVDAVFGSDELGATLNRQRICFDTVTDMEAAKDAAQADYERRIMSAIEFSWGATNLDNNGAASGSQQGAETSAESDAARYRWLRSRDLDAIQQGGVFAGLTPDNVILNGADLDEALDAAMGGTA